MNETAKVVYETAINPTMPWFKAKDRSWRTKNWSSYGPCADDPAISMSPRQFKVLNRAARTLPLYPCLKN
nr:hypothetical protein Q903MT_gene2965 [Picea sitchensis]